MYKIDIVPDKEMMEDLDGMLRDEEDYEHTMEMLSLTEDEQMIFKRARLHILRGQKNSPVIKKAYQIFVSKSFHNKSNNSDESQNILGQKEHSDSVFTLGTKYIKANLEYILIAFVIAFIIKKQIS